MPDPANYSRKLTKDQKREIRKMRRALNGHTAPEWAIVAARTLATVSALAVLAGVTGALVWGALWIWLQIFGA